MRNIMEEGLKRVFRRDIRSSKEGGKKGVRGDKWIEMGENEHKYKIGEKTTLQGQNIIERK